MTAGRSVTAVSATTVVVGRAIVVRVVVTTVGVGVFLFGNVEYDRVGRAVVQCINNYKGEASEAVQV